MRKGFLYVLPLALLLSNCKSSSEGGQRPTAKSEESSESMLKSKDFTWIRPGKWRWKMTMDMPNLPEGLTPAVEVCIDERQAHGETPLMNSSNPSPLNECKFEKLKLEPGHYAFRMSCPDSEMEADYRSTEDKMEGTMTITHTKTKQTQRMKIVAERIGDCP